MKRKVSVMATWRTRIVKRPTVTANEVGVALPLWTQRNSERSLEEEGKPPMEDAAAITKKMKKRAAPATDAAVVVGKKTRRKTTKNAVVHQGVAVSPPWIRRNEEKLLARVERPRTEDAAVTTRKKKAASPAMDAMAVKKTRTTKTKDGVVLRVVAPLNSMHGPAVKVTKTHN